MERMECFDAYALRSYVKRKVLPSIARCQAQGKVPFPMFHGTDEMVLEMDERDRKRTVLLFRRYVRYLHHRVPKDFWGWEEQNGLEGRTLAQVMTQEVPSMLQRWGNPDALALCGLGFACRYAIRAQYFGMVGRAAHYLALAERKAVQLGKITPDPLFGELSEARQLVERFWDQPSRPLVLMVEDLDASSFLTEEGTPALAQKKVAGDCCLRFLSDGFQYGKEIDLSHAIRIGVTPQTYGDFVQAYNLPFSRVVL